ncbi:MAG TPA: hypothetical protein VKB86_16220 [Pyrinomonadaceae bacterium]|nr:hypothetical protein [Pyrinomonadaceae bacterium]
MAAILPLFFILTTTLAQPATAASNVALNKEGQTEWYRVTPEDEEFSILTPVMPAFIVQRGGPLHGYGENISKHRSYSGYADGFIFIVESYKAERPRKLLPDLEVGRHEHSVFEREITINGFSGKQYRFNRPGFYGKELSFVTKHHFI